MNLVSIPKNEPFMIPNFTFEQIPKCLSNSPCGSIRIFRYNPSLIFCIFLNYFNKTLSHETVLRTYYALYA